MEPLRLSPVVDYTLPPGRRVLRSVFRAGSGSARELSGFNEKLAEVSGVEASELT